MRSRPDYILYYRYVPTVSHRICKMLSTNGYPLYLPMPTLVTYLSLLATDCFWQCNIMLCVSLRHTSHIKHRHRTLNPNYIPNLDTLESKQKPKPNRNRDCFVAVVGRRWPMYVVHLFCSLLFGSVWFRSVAYCSITVASGLLCLAVHHSWLCVNVKRYLRARQFRIQFRSHCFSSRGIFTCLRPTTYDICYSSTRRTHYR